MELFFDQMLLPYDLFFFGGGTCKQNAETPLLNDYSNLVLWLTPGLGISIIVYKILTAHEGNGEKLLSRGEIQPLPTIHRGP